MAGKAFFQHQSAIRTWMIAVTLFLAFLVLYLSSLSNNYSPDGMSFAVMTTRGPENTRLFFQAEHLLYPAVPWLWYQMWSLFGYTEGALRPLQVLNAIFGAGGIALFFIFLRRIFDEKAGAGLLSILGALALGLSYGYWFHSTEAENQIISITFVIAALLVLTRVRRGQSSPLTFAGLAFVAGLAVLFHATAVLFLPSLLLGLLPESRARRASLMLCIGLMSLMVVPLLVIGITAYNYHSRADFWHWIFAAQAKGVWGNLQVDNLAEAARAAATAVLYSGHFPNLTGSDEASALAPAGSILTGVILVGALSVLGYIIYRWPRFRRERWTVVALVWLVPTVVFNIYWAPEDIQFWIAAFVAMVVLTGLVWSDLLDRCTSWRRPLQGLAVMAVIVLLFGNFFGAMHPRSDLETNVGYAEVICLQGKTSESDLIITPGWDWPSGYLPYFARREVLSLADAYLLEAQGDSDGLTLVLQQRLSETRDRGGRVFAVRLFDMDKEKRDWYIEAVGFDPGGLELEHRPAGECLGRTFWEILS
ncbi:MAG: hypothetical protein ABIH46_08550 [Chloroflexota bacterium]